MRLLICAGGTGGGVYPALSVLKALGDDAEAVLWIGGEGGMEAELIRRESIPFVTIPSAGVHGVGLRSLPCNLLRLVRGTVAARRILRQFKPQVVFSTGGYVAAPVAVAAGKQPLLLYVPDIEPGLALKFLARFAHTIALTTPESRRYFSPRAHTVVTGYPTRPELKGWTPETGRSHLGLTAEMPVLLVAGGSKGARTINLPIFDHLPELLNLAQVVHITGSLDHEQASQVLECLPVGLRQRYHPMPYLHEMGAALASASLAVTRAGASTLGEYPLFGLPAILVPYQYAWRYQKVNADYLVQRGAAVMLTAEQFSGAILPTVQDLLSQPQKLQAMQSAMLALACPHAAQDLASLARQIAEKQSFKKEGPR